MVVVVVVVVVATAVWWLQRGCSGVVDSVFTCGKLTQQQNLAISPTVL
jgi:hypothetical protein